MKAPARTGPVTIKQVAEAAGVHFSTVSRALKPGTRHRVNPQIASRILETAQRLGYRTNTLASSLRTRRSYVVGVIVPDIASLLFPPILEGIEETLLREGYMTIVANSANDPERQRRILASMTERQVDGLIIASATLGDPVLTERPDTRAPIVLMNRTDDSGRAPAVLNDEVRGIGLAVRHLAALFQMAMTEHVRGRKPVVIQAEAFTREAGAAACARLIEQAPDTTAVVAANDLIALGCYDTLAASSITCPDEMSITGYNDAPFVDMVSPPLTTVRIRQREMGIEAARVLLARMNGQEIAADTLLRPELIERRSTAAPR
jgi:LacI family transcriptional regulator